MCIYAWRVCLFYFATFCHPLWASFEPDPHPPKITCAPYRPPWISRLSQTEYLFLFLCIRESLVVWAPRNEPISTAGGGGGGVGFPQLKVVTWSFIRSPKNEVIQTGCWLSFPRLFCPCHRRRCIPADVNIPSGYPSRPTGPPASTRDTPEYTKLFFFRQSF